MDINDIPHDMNARFHVPEDSGIQAYYARHGMPDNRADELPESTYVVQGKWKGYLIVAVCNDEGESHYISTKHRYYIPFDQEDL